MTISTIYLASLVINWAILLLDWGYLASALSNDKTLRLFVLGTFIPAINTITASVLISWLVLVILFQGTHFACNKVEDIFKGMIEKVKSLRKI